MRKLLFPLLLVSLASFALSAISGSSHDFSTGATWNSGGEICEPCHTPHNAAIDVPLWNHTNASTTGWTMYSSSTLVSGAAGSAPGTKSLMCLGCHDGVTAMDAFGGATAATTVMTTDASGYVGKDLSDDHPVGITYTATDAGLNATTTTVTTGITVANILEGGKVECTSCHDPHGGTASTKMLIRNNSASALCLACHNK